jgi:hypothetical protein
MAGAISPFPPIAHRAYSIVQKYRQSAPSSWADDKHLDFLELCAAGACTDVQTELRLLEKTKSSFLSSRHVLWFTGRVAQVSQNAHLTGMWISDGQGDLPCAECAERKFDCKRRESLLGISCQNCYRSRACSKVTSHKEWLLRITLDISEEESSLFIAWVSLPLQSNSMFAVLYLYPLR